MEQPEKKQPEKEIPIRIQGHFAVYKCKDCNGTGFDPYPNHSTTHAVCIWCNGTGEHCIKHAS